MLVFESVMRSQLRKDHQILFYLGDLRKFINFCYVNMYINLYCISIYYARYLFKYFCNPALLILHNKI